MASPLSHSISQSPDTSSETSLSRNSSVTFSITSDHSSSTSELAYSSSKSASSSSRSPDASPPFKKQRTWKVIPSKLLQHPSFLNELQICVNTIPNETPSQLESNFEKEKEEQFVTNLQEVESCVVSNELLEEAVHDFDNSNDDNSHLSSIVSLVVSSENSSNSSTSSDVDTWNDSSSDTLSENNSDDDILQPDKSPFLYDGSNSTVHEAVLDIIQDNFNNNETKKSLEDHLHTFLKHIPKPNYMPKSVHLLLKFVTSLAPSLTETAYPYCSKCHLFLEMEGNCEVCECAKRKYFYGFNVEKQIKFLFEHRNLGRVIDEYKSMIQTCPSRNIRDICNSSEYKRVQINDQCTVTLMFNTDGVQISKSKASLWPVQCIICEVPPHLRTSYMVVCAAWCDVEKPPMSTLLRPFVDTLKRLELGCVEWYDKVNRQHVKCKIIAPAACADGPARADIQNITASNSKYACNYCEQRSVTVPLTLQEQQARLAGNKKIRRRRAFVFREDSAKLREVNRMKSQARKACEGLPVKGVKGPSTVARIPRLDMSTFLVAEYMHTVCLCVVKRFLNLWLYEPGPWNISANAYAIDKLLEDIKPPDTVGRLPMEVSDISHWKASIFRMWLLCYSLPIISEFLPNIYVLHWCLFVQAIYLLLKEEISESEINMAEIMIKMFVRDIGILYRLKDYTISVHQLLHLPLCVRRWGPLWATSAFIFENYNGILKRLIHGTKNRSKELIMKLRVACGIQILKNKVREPNSDTLHHDDFELLNEHAAFIFSREERSLLLSNGIVKSVAVFARARKKRDCYTSLIYSREKKRNNYTIRFENANNVCGYGEIRFFVSCEKETDVKYSYAVIQLFQVEHSKIFYHEESRIKLTHIIPVISSAELIIVDMKIINLLKVVRVGNFVCLLPNKFETNL